jgi:hypothetical protein
MRFLTNFLIVICVLTNASPAMADKPCSASDKLCLLSELEQLAPKIDNIAWREQTYRELAKSYTHQGKYDQAISLVKLIKNPDTQAMTIRGIGFAAADGKWPRARYDDLFEKLMISARNIADPAGKEIALTYVAMAQAMALDDAGATATAKAMENEALKNKAFGETSEIQAERGDVKAAFESLSYIQNEAYKNKAYQTIAKIFVARGDITSAYQSALKVNNAYEKASILQMIINHGNPEESPAGDDSEGAAQP